MIRFSISDIGAIYATNYHRNNRMMMLVERIVDGLKKKMKSRTSKAEWSTLAVDMLLQMLISERVLRQNVSLVEYPEIVPLLFPFPFFDTGFMSWSSLNLITIGVDVRNIGKSKLARFFNMDVVNRLCRNGGVYVLTTEY